MGGNVSLSERQRRVLEVFADNYNNDHVLFYDNIASWSGLDHRSARLATRALKRKGFVAQSSCFDDEGVIRGSGHLCTKAGYELAQTLQVAA